MTEETAASGDWFERTLFVIALVVFLFLGTRYRFSSRLSFSSAVGAK